MQHLANIQLLLQLLSEAFPPCWGCQWWFSAQLSGQKSSPWLWILLKQAERPFKGSGTLFRCFGLISWLECDTLSLQYGTFSQYSNFLRFWIWGFQKLYAIIFKMITNKGLEYLTLHVMSLHNVLVWPFKLNYWNTWTFARYSNFLSMTCIGWRRQRRRALFWGLR